MRKVVVASGKSGADIDGESLRLIQHFQPEALRKPMEFDIERFFECALEELTDVKSDYKELQPGIEGYTDSDNLESVIALNLVEDTDIVQRRRCRATMGHETGHAVLHVHQFRDLKAKLKFIHDKDHISLRFYREDMVPTYCNPEWQAWRFAKGILMPAIAVHQAAARNYNLIDIAEAFGVNQAFARSRLKELKIRIKD